MEGRFGKHFRLMNRDDLKLCKYCDSGNIIKKGFRKLKQGKHQIFKCLECNKRFTSNLGFEHKRYDDKIIVGAMQMYYAGLSVRDISTHYDWLGIEVSHVTIYKWITQYSQQVSEYLENVMPHLSTWFRADEIWVKVAGNQKYLFASMDDDTRYWIASDMADTKFQHNVDTLLQLTKKNAGGKDLKQFITDGLPAYQKSSRRVFGRKTNHSRHVHLKGDMNNNKMERLNGEIRDREKVFRDLKRKDSPIITGMRIYYNFTKKHSALNGMTPAEVTGIKIKEKNKWKILIQNSVVGK